MKKNINSKYPEVGDWIQADGWKDGKELIKDNGFKDSEFPGCQFRVPMGVMGELIAVNIKITGKLINKRNGLCERIKIEFVGDGVPSEFSGGKLYRKEVNLQACSY